MKNDQLLKSNEISTAKVVFFNCILSYSSLFYIIAITTLFSCASENNTVKTVPQLTTTTISSISLNSAESGGNVTSDGGDAINTRGIVWNTVTSPTTSLTTKTTEGNGTGSFSSSITNLLPSSAYFVRAYAVNSIGTGYGNELSFTTGAVVLPTVSTTAITNITTNSAVSGGSITADGGSSITTRGIVWSTSQNPTIALTTKTTDGTALGSFISNMITLVQNTTYYVKAYATNSAGTAYGNQVEFKTTVDVYKNVQIGNQVWMTENLDVLKYSDGTLIPQVTDPKVWAALTTGAWCYNSNFSATDYGKLYNWYAVAGIYDAASLADPLLRKKLAPTGWHVPSDAEWTTLTDFLGGYAVAGGKMKETTTRWNYPNTGATNTSGFTGRPGGSWNSDGTIDSINMLGNWWSSSDGSTSSTVTAWHRTLYYDTGGFYSYNYRKWTTGFSVRCLKD